ncbi:hypothetical protein PsorP6_010705 [Peronosclerospora sorghi]|uniref:Uncharacterized protein n=1 Tax=Peronosclerospora sorghi TaxID=230839 RepID=A0ACC0VTU0_9STRA|nr:hypothetical protein PsorP6_010705 [Peronosclerospora sorghi]
MRFHDQEHSRIGSLLLFSIDPQCFWQAILIKRLAYHFARCYVLARQNIGVDGCIDAPVHTVSEQPIAKRNMRFYEQAHLRIGSLLLFLIAPQGFG